MARAPGHTIFLSVPAEATWHHSLHLQCLLDVSGCVSKSIEARPYGLSAHSAGAKATSHSIPPHPNARLCTLPIKPTNVMNVLPAAPRRHAEKNNGLPPRDEPS